MYEVRREIGERPQHVGANQEIRSRQREVGSSADEVPVKQHVKIHGAGSPSRRLPRAATECLYGAQHDEQIIHQQIGLERGDEIDKVRSFEACGRIPVPGGEARARESSRKLLSRQCHVLMGRNIAAGGDEDLRHGGC